MFEGLRWQFHVLVTRPRVIARALPRLGLSATLKLVWMRLFSSAGQIYSVRVPQFPHPVYLRGGKSSDMWSLYELLVMNEYGLLGSVPSARFIIDGGANIGLTSLCFLNQYPEARIVAVEPTPDNLVLCRKNFALYGDRVKLIPGASWKSPGSLVLELGPQAWANRVEAASGGKDGSVEGFTISSLLAYGPGKVDLLKLDVEGAEREIFGPGADDWLPCVDNLVIELHGEDCRQRFFQAMAAYDYDLAQDGDIVACRKIRVREAHATTPA